MTLDTVQVGSDGLEVRRSNAILKWRYLSLHFFVGATVMLAGAVEGRYGRLELSGDDISYLDVANMIRAGDWRAALNPLWSIGYPLLLSVVRRLFSSTLHGEMTAIFWLNLTIYFVTWIGFLWLLSLMSRAVQGELSSDGDARMSPFLLISAACVFVTVQTGVGRVSTIGPDLLVACLFFFTSGFALKVYSRPTVGNTALWGVVLGLGFLSKAIFLTLSGIFFLVAIVFMGWHRSVAPLLRTVVVLLLFVVPYGVGLSWALGRPTLGEAGALNYAFHVNHLKHWMGWQGGPKEFGSPIHPVEMLSAHPPVFAFGEPFHVTYPPQFNIVYWYEGYRQFFDFKNSTRALVENARALKYVFQEIIPVALVVALSFCVAFWPRAGERAGARRSLNPWRLYLPSLLGIFAFLLVHIEGRYVAGFLCVLGMAPFLRLDGWRGGLGSGVRATALVLLLVATLFNSAERLRGAVRLAAAGTDMQSGGQWAVAEYLRGLGLKAGDRVASVSPGNDIRCTWAYAARLHIVAAIGNDAYDPQNQVQDVHLFFDTPSIQAEVLEVFRRQGAVAVVATEIPFDVSSPGWQRVPGSRAWVLLLEPSASASR
ncbi:hypothetical protein RBB79_13375 [Tunturiibacter empetritectus]|uniref:Glycosyltransferase RgtA/B/C/D-like domain-containing protein n=1 Tax=Tunturiibacter lichenicola TaxID=2051959 RepID=A0A852VKF5_9BACT|nr:hypothetical protein [Edaphobacter lichenicola]NYF90595.1 hypothetical protein [Edaphobacter lichenicola]